MSYTAEELLKIAAKFEEKTSKKLEESSEKKKKPGKGKGKFPFWLKKKAPKKDEKSSSKKPVKKSAYYDAILSKFAQGVVERSDTGEYFSLNQLPQNIINNLENIASQAQKINDPQFKKIIDMHVSNIRSALTTQSGDEKRQFNLDVLTRATAQLVNIFRANNMPDMGNLSQATYNDLIGINNKGITPQNTGGSPDKSGKGGSVAGTGGTSGSGSTTNRSSKPGSTRKGLSGIDPIFQTMLNVNPDGKLGPQTQAALEVYKKSIKQPGVSNELAFEFLKQEPEYQTRTGMNYDDNANVYLVSNTPSAAKITQTTPRSTWGNQPAYGDLPERNFPK